MTDLTKKLVIFGASTGAVKVIKTLKSINVDIYALTDNDNKKWGKRIEDINIIAPACLKEIDCNIIIASNYQEEIEQQLNSMDLLERLVLKENYILRYMEAHLNEYKNILDSKLSKKKDVKQLIVLDLLECTEFGGIENWSYTVASGLKQSGSKVSILGNAEDIGLPEWLSNHNVEIEISYENYISSVLEIAKYLVKNLPCRLIINRQGQTIIAAWLIKQLYPGKLFCLSVIHTDRIMLYRRQSYMQDTVNIIMGVSNRIKNRLEREFHIPVSKLRFHESPVLFEDNMIRSYSTDDSSPLKIAYAARITKTQKRADLLPVLIKNLESKGVNYILDIAGVGDYESKLREQINTFSTKEHVNMMGLIPSQEMPDFWKKHDVLINLSEFEGTSLSMLEAMSWGTIPVVTEVSGVEDVITPGINGFICNQHDVDGIADVLKDLSKSREKLPILGIEARNIIKNKCRQMDYIEFICNIFNS